MTSLLLAKSYWPNCVCIGRVASVLGELRLYWPSCSVSADFVAHVIWTVLPYKCCITND